MTQMIDTDRFAAQLRPRGIDADSCTVAVTRFDGSLQEQDLTEPINCAGLGRVRHFHQTSAVGWPDNPLPIVPAARALGRDPGDTLRAQVFQNAICNWRCWYCYVDYPLLSGNPAHSEQRTTIELVDLFAAEPERPCVIDLTGGQPDLVPEWVPWMLDALADRDLAEQVYLWSDDNLSNDYFFQKLTPAQRRRLDTATNYGKVCCFKGYDARSFAFNTSAAPELFDRQFALMARLLRETELDVYTYVTLTSPTEDGVEDAVAEFVDRLQDLDPNLPLRTVPLQIRAFTPTRPRMTAVHDRALATQELAIEAWNTQLQARYPEDARATSICDVHLRRH